MARKVRAFFIPNNFQKLFMGNPAKGWTPERCKRQREAIRQWKPCNLSTGPKSPEGKAVVARNAWASGDWLKLREDTKTLNQAIQDQRERIRLLTSLTASRQGKYNGRNFCMFCQLVNRSIQVKRSSREETDSHCKHPTRIRAFGGVIRDRSFKHLSNKNKYEICCDCFVFLVCRAIAQAQDRTYLTSSEVE